MDWDVWLATCPEELIGFFDQGMLQLFDSERFLSIT
jgi:hypothetical protein